MTRLGQWILTSSKPRCGSLEACTSKRKRRTCDGSPDASTRDAVCER